MLRISLGPWKTSTSSSSRAMLWLLICSVISGGYSLKFAAGVAAEPHPRLGPGVRAGDDHSGVAVPIDVAVFETELDFEVQILPGLTAIEREAAPIGRKNPQLAPVGADEQAGGRFVETPVGPRG